MTRKLRITVEGKTYDVTVEVLDTGEVRTSSPQPASQPAPQPASQRPAEPSAASTPPPSSAPEPAETKPAPAAGEGDIPSPLAGKVVSVDVNVGDTVKSGQQVMTLEAMKMNTFVNAPSDGTVKSINVSAGDSVEEGQSLMSLS